MLVLAMTMAPASSRACTATLLLEGRQSLSAGVDAVVKEPATSMLALTTIGKPASLPRGSRAATLASTNAELNCCIEVLGEQAQAAARVVDATAARASEITSAHVLRPLAMAARVSADEGAAADIAAGFVLAAGGIAPVVSATLGSCGVGIAGDCLAGEAPAVGFIAEGAAAGCCEEGEEEDAPHPIPQGSSTQQIALGSRKRWPCQHKPLYKG